MITMRKDNNKYLLSNMTTEKFMEKEIALLRIGLKIKELREEKNISQQDLAAACNFEKSNMSRIEAGRTNLTIGTGQRENPVFRKKTYLSIFLIRLFLCSTNC